MSRTQPDQIASAQAFGLSRSAVTQSDATRNEEARIVIQASIIGWITAAVILAISIDAMLARAELLSPIPTGLGAVCILGGASLGVPIAYVAERWHRADTMPLRKSDAIGSPVLLGSFVGAIGMIAGLHLAARVAEIRMFAGRPVMTERTRVPIIDWISGKGGSFAVIAPFPGSRHVKLPIPGEDYDRLLAAGRRNGVSPYCYRITTERAGEAIRVVWPPRLRRFETRRIIACVPGTPRV